MGPETLTSIHELGRCLKAETGEPHSLHVLQYLVLLLRVKFYASSICYVVFLYISNLFCVFFIISIFDLITVSSNSFAKFFIAFFCFALP